VPIIVMNTPASAQEVSRRAKPLASALYFELHHRQLLGSGKARRAGRPAWRPVREGDRLTMTAAVTQQSGLDRYYTVKTLSARTEIAESTRWQWIRQRRVAAVKLPGGQVRIRESDVLALLTPK
jgi:excisionase family DNA binding protein